MKCLTIYDIKYLTQETAPCFFKRSTLKGFGQTMKSFKVSKISDTIYYISAPIYHNGKVMGKTERYFNTEDNNLYMSLDILIERR